MTDSLQPHGLKPTRLLCPWASPGKNTGVGCQSLLQGYIYIYTHTYTYTYKAEWYVYMYISYISICMYVSFFLSTIACLGIFNSVWNVVLEFSSVFSWFPERAFSPGRANVWFPLCFPPVVVECVEADSLHLQFVDKTLVEWITLSVLREENSSGLFIGIVYFISLNADCMPLILFFILFFFF